MPTEFDDTYRDLLKDLSCAAEYLDRLGEQHWASWLARDAERIRDGDAEGLRHLMSAYGGMGSISDLWLDPANGPSVHEEGARQVNEVLHGLLQRIWRSTKFLLGDLSDR